jgi:hypothetical protein
MDILLKGAKELGQDPDDVDFTGSKFNIFN